MSSFETVYWEDPYVVLIDQTKLPSETLYHRYQDPEGVALAIENMIVRGAPAIGVTAALGLALAAKQSKTQDLSKARLEFSHWCERFARTRPTAVNLFWGIEKMKHISDQDFSDTDTWSEALLQEALRIREEDISFCKKIGEHGAALIKPESKILTHCNAGALATAGWGTALGVIRSAFHQGKNISVWVDETRPFLQGARLTAWELMQEQIPATLITDNMAGYFIQQGEVDAIVIGADRIAMNGDVANKIGSYTLSVLAKEHGIPFYVAAPTSTIDIACKSGAQIPIEERSPEEVTQIGGTSIAPQGMSARHPGFDVSPAQNITAIITERGVAKANYMESLAQVMETELAEATERS
ncbi:MAG: S-methyl-5-thioribose-1-phosphate isomerase [Bdellovibrionales bacterium]|nr:S-methyl-5-thioribose-1-phosphate isomerase [Bdellovibrionales bacterium]